jgi:hypothetical protein
MGTSVSIADSLGIFSAETVTYKFHNGPKGGYIQPSTTIQGIPQTGDVTSIEYYLLLQNPAATEKNSNIYMYEFPSSNTTGLGASVDDSVFHRSRQFITLHKANAPNDTTYYRLDFYNPITKKFLDTKRNHHYLFTINKVRSEGYRTLSQAENNPGSNIEYTILINDGSTNVISNGQYAIVTNEGLTDTLERFTYGNTTAHVVKARYQFPPEMGGVIVPGTRNTIEVQTVTPGADADAFTVSPIFLSPTLTDIDVTIKPTILTAVSGVLIFRLGNITHRVYFKMMIDS